MPGNEESPQPPFLDPGAVGMFEQAEEELSMLGAALSGVTKALERLETQKADLESLMATTEKVIEDIRAGRTETAAPDEDIAALERSLAGYRSRVAALAPAVQFNTRERQRLEHALAGVKKGLI